MLSLNLGECYLPGWSDTSTVVVLTVVVTVVPPSLTFLMRSSVEMRRPSGPGVRSSGSARGEEEEEVQSALRNEVQPREALKEGTLIGVKGP